MKKLLKTSSVLAKIMGVVLILSGLWGVCFTYRNVSRENIVTPDDAALSGVRVRGPLSLKAQADIIRHHTLQMTGGKTYSEMPRQIEKLDENGKPVLGSDGKPVMVANSARDIWVTATALMTALNLGIVTYVFSILVILIGCISLWTGMVLKALAKTQH